MPFVVHQRHAVPVAVEGHPQVRTLAIDRLAKLLQPIRMRAIGVAALEPRIVPVVDGRQQAFREDGVEVSPRPERPTAVNGVQDDVTVHAERIDPHLLEPGHVVERDVQRPRVAARAVGRLRRRTFGPLAEPLDLVGARRHVADQPLQAVELGRIVRAGDDRATIGLHAALGVIDHRGGQLAEIDRIHPRGAEAVDQGVLEGRGGLADVAADHELGHRIEPTSEGEAPASIEFRRQVPGHKAPNVTWFVDAHQRPRKGAQVGDGRLGLAPPSRAMTRNREL